MTGSWSDWIRSACGRARRGARVVGEGKQVLDTRGKLLARDAAALTAGAVARVPADLLQGPRPLAPLRHAPPGTRRRASAGRME
jgi:hypothetical protein